MKNVYFLSYDGLSDPLGFSQIIPYLEIISKNNINLNIVSFEKKNKYKIHFNYINKILLKNNIKWHPLYYSNKFKKLSKIYDIFKFFFKVFFLIFLKKDVIFHARGHIPAYVAYFFHKIYKYKIIFDFRGLWIDERLDNGSININKRLEKYIYFFLKKLEKKTLNASSNIIVLTEKAKKELVNIYQVNREKLSIIPCCTKYPKTILSNKQILFSKKRLKFNKEDFILTYIGSLGGVYLLKNMLDFFLTMVKIKPNSFFFILTNNKEIADKEIHNNYYAIKKNIKVKNIQNHQISFYLSFTDYTISFINPTYARLASCPTKLSESFANGVPLISNKNYGDINDIILNFKCGELIKDFNTISYKKTINKILNSEPPSRQFIIENTLDYFDINNAKKKYNFVYKDILSE